MGKISFDKYYTPPTTARWCIEKAYEIIGKENITEIVEPSAGSGSFSHQIKGCKAYDLYPQHEYIEEADFLKLKLGYKKGRLFIGNPPFGGNTGQLIKAFKEKCYLEGDYIAFIQPPSFYNNYSQFNKMEIIYSVLLKADYTNKELMTSFNIYKRNPDKNDFKNEIYTLKDVTLKSVIRNNQNKIHNKHHDCDYYFVKFGQIFTETTPYKHVSCIGVKVNNKKYKDEVISALKWFYHYNKEHEVIKMVATNSVTSQTIYKLLKILIPELE